MINIDHKGVSPELATEWKRHIYDILGCCQAVHKEMGPWQRQQLWNYMRLSKIPFGILYNFAPIKDQCEKYHLDTTTNIITAF